MSAPNASPKKKLSELNRKKRGVHPEPCHGVKDSIDGEGARTDNVSLPADGSKNNAGVIKHELSQASVAILTSRLKKDDPLSKKAKTLQRSTTSFSNHCMGQTTQKDKKLSIPLNQNSNNSNLSFSTILDNSNFLSPDNANRRASIQLLKEKMASEEGRRFTIQSKVQSWFAPAISPVNIKLFGGKRAIEKEKWRSRQAGWIIHPMSTLR